MTNEDRVKSFELQGRDSKDYFDIGHNFSEFIDLHVLKAHQKRLRKQVMVMQDFRRYVRYLQGEGITIKPGSWTMQCEHRPAFVRIGIFPESYHGGENRVLLGLPDRFSQADPSGKLTMIIVSLNRILSVISERIAYLRAEEKPKKERRRGIRIEIEKILINKEKYVKVISVTMLRREELPGVYTQTGESVCVSPRKNYVEHTQDKTLNFYFLSIGGKGLPIREAEWERILAIIQRCGDRLMKINAQLKKDSEGWEGKETVII